MIKTPVIPKLLTISLLFTLPAKASDIGGISATSNPVANSSGQATVNAYQVLNGTYMNSTFTGGVNCQSSTLTVTPYAGATFGQRLPFEETYQEPVYDLRDIDGDSVPDNPGDILFEKTIQTLQKDNLNLTAGFTASWSKSLDKKMVDLCRTAATNQIALQQASLNMKVLDYEISRLKHCGNLAKEGIVFASNSKYAAICADVRVMNPPGVLPDHSHSIPEVEIDEIEEVTSSDPAEIIGVHERKAPWASSP